MKLIILTPNRAGVFTKELEEKLSDEIETLFITKPQKLQIITELQSDEEKILAIDPDFLEWSVTSEDIDFVKNLKAICLQTTSFGWINTSYAQQLGITVTNLRGFSTEAVAEFALMMTLSLARKMPIVIHDGYKQDFVKHQGIELKGKKVGIVGLGSIGKRYAELCAGVGMEVSYWSRGSKDDRFTFLELENLLEVSDIIFPAMADNDETKKILTNKLLTRIKPSALFVSIAHKLYDHSFVIEMVKVDKLFGYAFEEENGSPLNYTGNILALPSLAWATDGSMKKNGQLWTEAILKALHGTFPTRIN